MAFVVDGKSLAQAKEAELKTKVASLKTKGLMPQLVSILVSDDEAGLLYTRLKQEAAERIGVQFVIEKVNKFSADNLLNLIEKYTSDTETHGIIIQRPGGAWRIDHGLNRQQFEADWSQLVMAISPQKDVDGLRQDSPFTMATVRAVEIILKETRAQGKTVVVGSEGLVGRLLVKKLSAVGVDLETSKLETITAQADILISATGQKDLIKPGMVKRGAVVIDVGWPKGDVEFESVAKKASIITPVPGGVGPLTVVSLLENLVNSVYSRFL